jgi:hypothetical protein
MLEIRTIVGNRFGIQTSVTRSFENNNTASNSPAEGLGEYFQERPITSNALRDIVSDSQASLPRTTAYMDSDSISKYKRGDDKEL